jgi:hypothetical protein
MKNVLSLLVIIVLATRIFAGDEVLADDPLDGLPPAANKVHGKMTSSSNQWRLISWDKDGDGKADATVKATEEHPFFVQGRGWEPAHTLKTGQKLLMPDGNTVTIAAVGYDDHDAKTCNLDIDGPSTFFVWENGSAVLVHNTHLDVFGFNERPLGNSVSQRPSTLGQLKTNEQHHFFIDKWVDAHYPGVYSYKTRGFPMIELHYHNHRVTIDEFHAWRHRQNPVIPWPFDWKQISHHQMMDCARAMAGAGGIPKSVVEEWFSRLPGWLHIDLKKRGCLK